MLDRGVQRGARAGPKHGAFVLGDGVDQLLQQPRLRGVAWCRAVDHEQLSAGTPRQRAELRREDHVAGEAVAADGDEPRRAESAQGAERRDKARPAGDRGPA